ncbi:MAG: integrase [Candidatus Dormiibacter spiritus]|uniref:Tyrosine-type recombinase/integrase n=1 Tax=Candidatus Nephthysia bennettiae TaxID=3127016 RepID=A0A934JX21_9BACT|nr:tyrosine-type recombinase/integrase [Candidatus Dormibacteraeota bacterium]PZR67192.1 MAG: integrase [Candidatus Dormibacteraeota bacterium]
MLVPSPPPTTQLRFPDVDAATSLATLDDQAASYARASKAENTIRSYRVDLADFQAWCDAHALSWLPATPKTIALYVTAQAQDGRKVATIEHRLAAISVAHQVAGHWPSPTSHPDVRTTMQGIRRTHGTAQQRKVPLGTKELRRLMRVAGPTPLAEARDRALLLLGFAAALRRSELVSLDVRDLEDTENGLTIHLRRSKTDQEAAGEDRGIPFGQHPDTCPIRTLRQWLQVSGIADGPVFRGITRHGQLQVSRLSTDAVADIVKRACAAAGLDPSRYAGHSLRSGLATSSAEGEAPERSIMRQGGWRSERTMRKYIRPATIWKENAAAYCGL